MTCVALVHGALGTEALTMLDAQISLSWISELHGLELRCTGTWDVGRLGAEASAMSDAQISLSWDF